MLSCDPLNSASPQADLRGTLTGVAAAPPIQAPRSASDYEYHLYATLCVIAGMDRQPEAAAYARRYLDASEPYRVARRKRAKRRLARKLAVAGR